MKPLHENVVMKTKYVDNITVDILVGRYVYDNDVTCVLALDSATGEPVMKISTTVGVPIQFPFFICKNYSENEGVAEWLEENNIAKRTGHLVFAGEMECPIMCLFPPKDYNPSVGWKAALKS